MNIFEYDDYRTFLADWIRAQPGKGRGTLKKWAAAASVHSTLISQIMAGKKDMSLELAEQISRVIGLSEGEFDYFSLLVLFARSGTTTLREQLKRRIMAEQDKARNMGTRLKVAGTISEDAKTTFYSSWLYAGVRNLAATPSHNSVDQLAKHLGLPRTKVLAIVQFLVEEGLCVVESGRLMPGVQRTHASADSPHVLHHHRNWRVLGFQKMEERRGEDLFFTFPMSLAQKDAKKIREMLPAFIESIHKIVGTSESETVRCLNVDLFAF